MRKTYIMLTIPLTKKIWTSTISFIFIISCSLFTSCKKFVDVEPPENQLVAESVFINDATAISALTSIYSLMTDENTIPYLIPELTGLTGDELVTYSSFDDKIQAYQNGLNPVDASTNSIWNLAYKCIYNANTVYEECNKSTQLKEAVKTQLMGEARFIRAFWHFYLANLFGDVPLVTSTDYRINATLKRQPQEEVYKQIVTDLTEAKSLLNAEYVAGNSYETGGDRIRPNKSAAAALLSRVYLYMKNYQAAETEATTVISNPLYKIVDVTHAFNKDSEEAIWQLAKPDPTSDVNTWEGAYFILNERPASFWNNSSVISNQLLESFDDADLRKSSWIGKVIDSDNGQPTEYSFPFKYKVQYSSDISEYSIVLRLAEQYLIRAESRAEEGNIAAAIDDLDILRTRAGVPLLSETNPTIPQQQLLDEVYKERQKELFAEWGHRWMDMKRSGRINEIMQAVSPLKGGAWNPNKQYWPIPQRELDNNSNLIQNLGYN